MIKIQIHSKLFSKANSESDLSKVPLPAIIVFLFKRNSRLENFLPNFITAPSNSYP